MTAPDWDHWADNSCDACSKPLHPAAGALCVRCGFDFELEETA